MGYHPTSQKCVKITSTDITALYHSTLPLHSSSKLYYYTDIRKVLHRHNIIFAIRGWFIKSGKDTHREKLANLIKSNNIKLYIVWPVTDIFPVGGNILLPRQLQGTDRSDNEKKVDK